MTNLVLVGIDGSEQSDHALTYAIETFPDAEILAVHVIDPVETLGYDGYDSISMTELRQEAGEEICEAAESFAAETHDRDVETRIRLGRPARSLVEVVDEEDVDHVVVGSHGRTGLTRVLLGSVAESVVRRAPVPVTVVR